MEEKILNILMNMQKDIKEVIKNLMINLMRCTKK